MKRKSSSFARKSDFFDRKFAYVHFLLYFCGLISKLGVE